MGAKGKSMSNLEADREALKKYLRGQSKLFYPWAHEAADRIEELERQLASMTASTAAPVAWDLLTRDGYVMDTVRKLDRKEIWEKAGLKTRALYDRPSSQITASGVPDKEEA
jgi:hypothetical protein